jgi:hypothetical protein
MGQYFYFYHKDENEDKKVGDKERLMIPKLDNYSKEYIISLFLEAINVYRWKDGEIIAQGDYGTCVSYSTKTGEITITYEEVDEEEEEQDDYYRDDNDGYNEAYLVD